MYYICRIFMNNNHRYITMNSIILNRFLFSSLIIISSNFLFLQSLNENFVIYIYILRVKHLYLINERHVVISRFSSFIFRFFYIWLFLFFHLFHSSKKVPGPSDLLKSNYIDRRILFRTTRG